MPGKGGELLEHGKDFLGKDFEYGCVGGNKKTLAVLPTRILYPRDVNITWKTIKEKSQ